MGTGSSYPAGWYQGPNDPDGVMRYYDGTTWTDHTSGGETGAPPAASPPPATPPPARPSSISTGTTAIPTGAAAAAAAAPPGTPGAPGGYGPPPGAPPQGVLGQAGTTYTAPPGAPQGPPPGVTIGGPPPSGGSNNTAIIIGAIAAVFVVIVLIGGFLFFRSRGSANLEPSQAIDALPSSKQLSDATGLSLGAGNRETRTSSQIFEGDSSGSCQFGTVSNDGFKSAARVESKAGDAAVETTVVVYDTGDNAAKGYRDFSRVLERLKACGQEAGADQDNEVSSGDASGGTFILANSKKGKGGAGFAGAPTGNAVVLVTIFNTNAKVSQEQVTKALQASIDAAKTPDPSRR